MSFSPTVWEWDESASYDRHHPITIEQCRQRDGSILYAVRQAGACMSMAGKWEHEPIPSSRDDEFMERFRFKTCASAIKAILWYCKPHGRFQPR